MKANPSFIYTLLWTPRMKNFFFLILFKSLFVLLDPKATKPTNMKKRAAKYKAMSF